MTPAGTLRDRVVATGLLCRILRSYPRGAVKSHGAVLPNLGECPTVLSRDIKNHNKNRQNPRKPVFPFARHVRSWSDEPSSTACKTLKLLSTWSPYISLNLRSARADPLSEATTILLWGPGIWGERDQEGSDRRLQGPLHGISTCRISKHQGPVSTCPLGRPQAQGVKCTALRQEESCRSRI